jgi:hypothetical protein
MLPKISFKEFLSNPIIALFFMCVMALGYLHYSQTNNFEKQIEVLQNDIGLLKEENKTLNLKIIEILTKVDK